MNYNDTLVKLLQNSSSWTECKKKLSAYNTNKTEATRKTSTAGKLFEYFCKYYFLTEPTIRDNYKQVWLFHEVPDSVKEKLNISGNTEYGVDIILEDTEGKYTAVQCKFRNDEATRLSWSKDKIANLFGYVPKADYFTVFTNASELDDVSKGRTENFSLYTIADLLAITPETFIAIQQLLEGKKVVIAKASPRDYQIQAIDTVVNHLQTYERGQLILPCGTGKTLISLWIKEKLRPKTTLVLVPSLALLRQTKNEWAYHKRQPYKYLCVCSESDIDKNADTPEVHTYELQAKVTTNATEIQSFLARDGEKIIFSTYHSLPAIAEAMQGSDFSFDLVFCDEAHKTAGSRKGNTFTLVHDNTKIPAKKRLYMTATPKILSASLKANLDENAELLADMSNPVIYGTEAYRMSFKEAIERGILVDYRIVAIGVTDGELQEYLAQRQYVTTKESIDQIANNYALNLVMEKYQANHALTFHSRVSLAKNFSERQKDIVENLYAEYVSGSQTTSTRSKTIEAFKEHTKAVLSNARCLTEGVDVPIIDMIYFCDPKYSTIDIVQAAGRAMRKDKHGVKKMGYIVVPIYHSRSDDIEEAINESVFKNLIQVIRSMCDQDERLQEEINSIAITRGKRALSHVDFVFKEQGENIVNLVGFEEKLKEALFNQVIEKTKNNWDVQYQYLLEFRRQYPDRWPKHIEEFPKNNKIGIWLDYQRQNKRKGLLPQEKIDLLNKLGFVWYAGFIRPDWQTQYNNLLEYRKNNPNKWPQIKEEYPKDNMIGVWASRQRRDYRRKKLAIIKIQLLNNIDFLWEVKTDTWEPQYNNLKEFFKINLRQPYKREEYPLGNKLGIWCQRQISLYNFGKLSEERILKLNNIGFIWDKINDRWGKQYNYLIEFRKQYPDRWPVLYEEYPVGNKLGYWCSSQRQDYAKKKMSKTRYNLLAKIGFSWDAFEDTWNEQYKNLLHFRRKNQNRWPTSDEEYPSGNKIGVWCRSQRESYKEQKLDEKRIEKLEKIGFIWENSYENLWNIQYRYLLNYRKNFPNTWTAANEEYPAGNNLGNWVSSQRQSYKKHLLSIEQINLLNKINFQWDPLEGNWLVQFNNLQEYKKYYPNIWPKIKEQYSKGKELNLWCILQRKTYKKGLLNKERIDLLNKINFVWDLEDFMWDKQYQYLVEFKESTGRFPASAEEYPRENLLGQWCYIQKRRYHKKTIDKLQIDKLEKINFIWGKREDPWFKKYNYLVEYKKLYPDRWPKLHEEYPKGNKIGSWCSHQRRNAKNGKLNKVKLTMLEKINFVFDTHDSKWSLQYNFLLEYRKLYPNHWPLIEEEYPIGNSIGIWISKQRDAYKNENLDSEYVEKLNQIGFVWSKFDALWMEGYNLLVEYRSLNPNSWPKYRDRFKNGFYLGDWFHKQLKNYKLGELSEERIKLLKKLGFPSNLFPY